MELSGFPGFRKMPSKAPLPATAVRFAALAVALAALAASPAWCRQTLDDMEGGANWTPSEGATSFQTSTDIAYQGSKSGKIAFSFSPSVRYAAISWTPAVPVEAGGSYLAFRFYNPGALLTGAYVEAVVQDTSGTAITLPAWAGTTATPSSGSAPFVAGELGWLSYFQRIPASAGRIAQVRIRVNLPGSASSGPYTLYVDQVELADSDQVIDAMDFATGWQVAGSAIEVAASSEQVLAGAGSLKMYYNFPASSAGATASISRSLGDAAATKGRRLSVALFNRNGSLARGAAWLNASAAVQKSDNTWVQLPLYNGGNIQIGWSGPGTAARGWYRLSWAIPDSAPYIKGVRFDLINTSNNGFTPSGPGENQVYWDDARLLPAGYPFEFPDAATQNDTNKLWSIFGGVNDGNNAVNLYGQLPDWYPWSQLKIMWSDETDYREWTAYWSQIHPFGIAGYPWTWDSQEKWPTGTTSCVYGYHAAVPCRYITGIAQTVAWRGNAILSQSDPSTVPGAGGSQLVDSFDSTSGWTIYEGGTGLSTTSAVMREGKSSLKVSYQFNEAGQGQWMTIWKSLSSPVAMANKTLRLRLFNRNDSADGVFMFSVFVLDTNDTWWDLGFWANESDGWGGEGGVECGGIANSMLPWSGDETGERWPPNYASAKGWITYARKVPSGAAQIKRVDIKLHLPSTSLHFGPSGPGENWIYLDDLEIRAAADADVSAGMTTLQKCRRSMEYLLYTMRGRSGLIKTADLLNTGLAKGMPSSYWDNSRAGYLDAYTNLYWYAALRDMAAIERTQSNIADAAYYEALTAQVRSLYNATFWNAATGRYADWIGADLVKHDKGFTSLNLEAVWAGLPDDAKADSILQWLEGIRTVASDTATNLYQTNFAPRSNTVAYSAGEWEDLNGLITVTPGGNSTYGQHQANGGFIFYTSFYDLLARSRYRSADNALTRLNGILNEFRSRGWDLSDNSLDPTNNMGARWKWGITHEFPESGLVPTFPVYGWLGIKADVATAKLTIQPNLPSAWNWSGLNRMHYRGRNFDVQVSRARTVLTSLQGTAQTLSLDAYGAPSVAYEAVAQNLNGPSTVETVTQVTSGADGKIPVPAWNLVAGANRLIVRPRDSSDPTEISSWELY